MRRRQFISGLFGTAIGWPLVARARTIPVIGFLSSESEHAIGDRVSGFRRGLAEAGYAEGQNVSIEYRWAESQYERVPVLAADLVQQRVDLIFANYPAVLSAKAATATIPIVFTSGADPVKAGLVASFSRPGGNVTGVYLVAAALDTKRLELLHQLIPGAAALGVLANPQNPITDRQLLELQQATNTINLEIHVVRASTEPEIDAAFAAFAQQRVDAVLVGSDPFFASRRTQLVVLAARHRLPTIYNQREYVESGGLVSYGADFADGYRQAGVYAGKILQGARPADLPVVEPVKLELVINLTTAKALGLNLPPTLLARADEVIE